MTGIPEANDAKFDKVNENLRKIEDLNKRFINAIARKEPTKPGLLGPGQDLYANAMSAYLRDAISDPAKLLEQQVSYWGQSLQLWMDAQKSLVERGGTGSDDEGPKDARFKNELWEAHPYFKLVKDQYLLNAEAMSRAVNDMDGLDTREKRRIKFFSQQIIDMMSPANFLGTNPEALSKAIETEGDSLVRGLENLVRDIEKNDGELLVTLSDPDAFKVGENLASTEGSVVFRNHLFELIQYAPRTEVVYKVPLVIVPPWINKFYILDLKPENSFIKWAVEQGFTVFVVSWVNPGPELRDAGMEAYAADGCMAAIGAIKNLTGEKQVNAIGYCIGGTLLAAVLAYMQKVGDKSVRSATFFTTLTDFTDMGELSVFVTDDFVDNIEKEVEEKGMLRSIFMSRAFSFMRARDLVYGPAIRSYMMGERPPAFDLLYWNGDSTNLPARMAIEYLRGLCQSNSFAKGEFELMGKNVSLSDVQRPLMAIACETDHIADWKNSFKGIQKMGSRDKTFVLSESGHIAGIINPPSKGKYGHFTCEDLSVDPDSWKEKSEFHKGSWWDRWAEWAARRSGAKQSAQFIQERNRAVLAPAPGTYVVESAVH